MNASTWHRTPILLAAALNCLAMTNQMWTKDSFAALDRVTVGERAPSTGPSNGPRRAMPARPAGRRSGSPACR
jgi:hypothetical protein